ncbi:uncharacterized protein G2W53_005143 [Senna tora]|uniref:Uncharacterized protein n=1 Tax=Senna tora TaxID=362788 RepID=A0A834TMW6_9FABA|nr:uncharacterized protein G2W53_039945 [Senna tora]KAF7809576.1 uncharacterized protein G2W53_036319 [Senna tora]KAF7825248.1 uncharacterized protein G2W53_016412 [Senna tora]KAF7842845.1 uncharacterized protein G2W53_005143 [Senna tora]
MASSPIPSTPSMETPTTAT